MNRPQLILPIDPAHVSDGYHTFAELYNHRHMLFLVLMRLNATRAWFSSTHADGSGFNGYFVAGIDGPTGTVTYHLPDSLWAAAKMTAATCLEIAKPFDGHTSEDVIHRLLAWANINRCDDSQPSKPIYPVEIGDADVIVAYESDIPGPWKVCSQLQINEGDKLFIARKNQDGAKPAPETKEQP